MEIGVAATRWAETWQRAWPAGDAAAIELLYAPHASYRSSALADPEPGGVTAYLARQFAAEQDVRCRFVADGVRAAVEWWASWVEDARPSLSTASPSCGSRSTVELSTTSTTGCRPEADESRTRAGPADPAHRTLQTYHGLLTRASRSTITPRAGPRAAARTTDLPDQCGATQPGRPGRPGRCSSR